MQLLTILVPTKDYKIGLQRIIESIPEKHSKIKIIISDDSRTDVIKKYIYSINRKNITYIKNKKTLGLAKNWNQLLSNCESKYFMFLHNDDFINDKFFFDKFYKFLKEKNNPDIISCATRIINYKIKLKKLHIKSPLRKFLYLISKKYILKRNYIGPVSSLIIKNNKIPKFDTEIKWLVDVDFYYRIFKNNKIFFTDQLEIISEFNNKSSQHFLNRKIIGELNKKEFYYLVKKYNLNRLKVSILKLFEPFFWLAIRAANLVI